MTVAVYDAGGVEADVWASKLTQPVPLSDDVDPITSLVPAFVRAMK
jgi:hypothetical protein